MVYFTATDLTLGSSTYFFLLFPCLIFTKSHILNIRVGRSCEPLLQKDYHCGIIAILPRSRAQISGGDQKTLWGIPTTNYVHFFNLFLFADCHSTSYFASDPHWSWEIVPCSTKNLWRMHALMDDTDMCARTMHNMRWSAYPVDVPRLSFARGVLKLWVSQMATCRSRILKKRTYFSNPVLTQITNLGQKILLRLQLILLGMGKVRNGSGFFKGLESGVIFIIFQLWNYKWKWSSQFEAT